MEPLLQDLRLATRRLLKRPGFTLIAIVSVGIGIGANTAIFSLVNAVMMRKAPLDRPGELVDLYKTLPGFTHGPLSFPDLRDLQDETTDVFAGVAGFRLALAQTDLGGSFESLVGELVTGNYFSLLGIRAQLGRTLLPSDDVAPGAHPVVVLSHDYWLRVISPAFYAPRMMTADLQPSSVNELEERRNQSVFVQARLKPGATMA